LSRGPDRKEIDVASKKRNGTAKKEKAQEAAKPPRRKIGEFALVLRVPKEAVEYIDEKAGDPDGALRAVAALALGRRLTTWLPPDPLLIAHFEDRGRATTRPMLLGVDAPETGRFPSADYF